MSNKIITLWRLLTPGPENNKEEQTINIAEFNNDVTKWVAYFMDTNAKFVSYNISRYLNTNLTRLLVTYNVSQLTPAEIVNIYNDIRDNRIFVRIGEYTSQIHLLDFRNTVFPYWCSQKSNTPLYATDPINGKILKEASYFRSNTNLGLYCRIWEIDPAAVGVEESQNGYCFANPTSFECECINSKSSSYYKAFNNPDNIPDGCWYKPCNMKTNAEGFDDYVYFVPKSKQNPVCPKNNNITFNENQTLVTKEEADKYYNVDKKDDESSSSFLWLYILIFIIVAAIIIIGTYIYKKQKRKKVII